MATFRCLRFRQSPEHSHRLTRSILFDEEVPERNMCYVCKKHAVSPEAHRLPPSGQAITDGPIGRYYINATISGPRSSLNFLQWTPNIHISLRFLPHLPQLRPFPLVHCRGLLRPEYWLPSSSVACWYMTSTAELARGCSPPNCPQILQTLRLRRVCLIPV